MSTHSRVRVLSYTCSTLPLVMALVAHPSQAQEFTPVVPPAIADGVAAFVDLGLPPPSTTAELASGVARPFGLIELDAAGVSAGCGWRALRVAAGLARSGDALLGWQALGGGIGCAGAQAGVAMRAVVRRDRSREPVIGDDPSIESWDPPPIDSGPPGAPVTGSEIGAGGWIQLSSSVKVWVAHPQVATRGAAPPLRRALEAGIAWRGTTTCAWLVRESAPRTRGSDTHRAGLALGAPRIWLWSEMRDAPLRAAVGVAARAGPLAIAAVADMHPVLPPSARLSLSLGGAAW